MQLYFFANGSEKRGPYTVEDLAGFGLRPDTLVWREGMDDWRRLDSVPELLERIPVAATVNPEASDNEISLAPLDPASPPPMFPPVANAMLTYQSPDTTASNGLAVASLVLGIVSIPGLCLYFVGTICAILAVIFGFIARKRSLSDNVPGAGMALAGIICGFVSLGIVLIIVALIVVIAITN